MFIIIGAATLMLPIAIFALLGLSALMFANDVTDDDDTREPAPDENPDTTPVDSIYDEPEIDPETGEYTTYHGLIGAYTYSDMIGFGLAKVIIPM